MSTTLIVPSVVTTIGAIESVAAGSTFALPVSRCTYALQVDLDEDQTFTLLVQTSLDGTTWFTLQTITQADMGVTAVFALTAFSAKFIRVNVTVNATPILITSKLLATKY